MFNGSREDSVATIFSDSSKLDITPVDSDTGLIINNITDLRHPMTNTEGTDKNFDICCDDWWVLSPIQPLTPIDPLTGEPPSVPSETPPISLRLMQGTLKGSRAGVVRNDEENSGGDGAISTQKNQHCINHV